VQNMKRRALRKRLPSVTTEARPTVAVFGVGRMGRVHAENLLKDGNAKLAGVADVDAAAAERLVRDLGHGRVDTVDGFLRDPAVDAVIIATPTPTHAGLVTRAAAARKPIFCEKPISLEVGTTLEAIQACKDTGVVLQIGFQRRYDRDFERARNAIETGRLGETRFIRLVSRDRTPPPISYISTSGGQYKDQMVHDFDAARWLLAPAVVEEVTAVGSAVIDRAIAEAGDVDTAVALLRFSNGAIAVLDDSREAIYGYDVRVEIHGSGGMLLIGGDGMTDGTLLDASFLKPQKDSFISRFSEAYRCEIADFVEIVANGKRPRVTGDDALQALRIAIAADRSLKEGRTVKLSDVNDG
jgi:myo-inositol 2-dehydrogenase / D-chiro-inositol 1-dehydrogenase